MEYVRRLLPPLGNLSGTNVGQRLARAHRRAHRPLANRRAVVAHVAFHHLLEFRKDLRNAEGAREHTVGAADAARLQGRLHNAVVAFLDRIRRADHRTSGLFTMPADVRGRGRRTLRGR